jgi:hypothetical protein
MEISYNNLEKEKQMKSKKILTILLSLAIMVTFMPLMAFADAADPGPYPAAKWTSKLAKVTDTKGRTFDTNRTFDPDYGYVVADPQDDTSVQGATVYAPESDGYFYDFDGSAFVGLVGTEYKAINGLTYTQAAAEDLTIYIQLVEQNYTVPYVTGQKTKASEAATWKKALNYKIANSKEDTRLETVTIGNYKYDVWQSAYEKGAEKDQQVKIYVKSIDAVGEVDVTDPDKAEAEGTVADATITVKGVDKTPQTANIYLDSTDGPKSYIVEEKETLIGLYTGAARTVVMDAVPGWTVEYSVYDSKTGHWGAATNSVSITDVQEKAMKVKATFTETATKNTQTRTFEVNLVPEVAAIGFDLDASYLDDECAYKVGGADYNAADYLKVDAFQYTAEQIKAAETAEIKDLMKKRNAANAAAVKANSSALFDLFSEVFEVKATVSKESKNIVSLTYVTKDLSAAEKKAIEEKYATLMRNFGLEDYDDVAYYLFGKTTNVLTNATVTLNADAIVDTEVEFVKAPTVKTYKGSKTTKKGKLKKNQSFTVKAVSNDGNPVYYKLVNVNTSKITINKKTGKITVKKGLAKGTYNVKVKAYVPYSKEVGWNAYEYQTIKVKIKK